MLYRQGDVLLKRVEEMPADAVKLPRDGRRVVLAYGETTGHAHAVLDRGAELYESKELEARFLQVLADGGVDLVHEEHATIPVPPGTYEVVRQREYSPEEIREVAD
jgi:hypothetical protein